MRRGACVICEHAERAAIDAELAEGASRRGVGQRYRVSYSALVRHGHHPGRPKPSKGEAPKRKSPASRERLEVSEAAELLDRLVRQQLEKLETAGLNPVDHARVSTQLTMTLQRLARMRDGEVLDEARILRSHAGRSLSKILVEALRPWPDAAIAVADAIQAAEGDGGH